MAAEYKKTCSWDQVRNWLKAKTGRSLSRRGLDLAIKRITTKGY